MNRTGRPRTNIPTARARTPRAKIASTDTHTHRPLAPYNKYAHESPPATRTRTRPPRNDPDRTPGPRPSPSRPRPRAQQTLNRPTVHSTIQLNSKTAPRMDALKGGAQHVAATQGRAYCAGSLTPAVVQGGRASDPYVNRTSDDTFRTTLLMICEWQAHPAPTRRVLQVPNKTIYKSRTTCAASLKPYEKLQKAGTNPYSRQYKCNNPTPYKIHAPLNWRPSHPASEHRPIDARKHPILPSHALNYSTYFLPKTANTHTRPQPHTRATSAQPR